MKGQIVQKNKKFYFKIKGEGEFEMGLLSDGYRKLSMIIYMILSGSLNKDTILFWDEPETNMNPKDDSADCSGNGRFSSDGSADFCFHT